MTTAHRPTFDPARGKEAARGEAYHQRLLPAHKTLKFRQATQGTPDEQRRRNLKAQLLQAEAKHYNKNAEIKSEAGDATSAEDDQLLLEGAAGSNGEHKRSIHDVNQSADDDEDADEDYEAKKRRILEETKDIDADSDGSSSEESEDDDDDDDEDGDDPDTELLQRELAKIKAERAQAAAKLAAEQTKKDEEQREKDIALGNPLLNARKDYGVKRRWDDDVVFKNQARGTEEKGKEKRFVNDLLRSDFHRKFMDKYVR